jgi:hypothetical protein
MIEFGSSAANRVPARGESIAGGFVRGKITDGRRRIQRNVGNPLSSIAAN